MRTEMRYEQRVWTKKSVETILDCSRSDKTLSEEETFKKIKKLVSEGLIEAGFRENKDTLFLEKKTWKCEIKIVHLPPFFPTKVHILIEGGSYKYDCTKRVEDLIFLWDTIRKGWEDYLHINPPQKP